MTSLWAKLSVELRPPADPEEDRHQLFLAVSDRPKSAASTQPLILVLEDLRRRQWYLGLAHPHRSQSDGF